MRERTEMFKQGQVDYNNGVKLKSQHSYSPEYLNGWHFQERLTRGNSMTWCWPKGYKSSSSINNWRLGK